ncbi:hypothetical protein BDA96_03G383800 [Sorghum bicolor]|uniref:Uncharacterized protein n=1 Tax=Sorghum bicolor TaxID=4558 RepID=A0A921RGW4_SORBI|nr:hypothetical protein BDA96_03G383800 [Sorghum bicolor]
MLVARSACLWTRTVRRWPDLVAGSWPDLPPHVMAGFTLLGQCRWLTVCCRAV